MFQTGEDFLFLYGRPPRRRRRLAFFESVNLFAIAEFVPSRVVVALNNITRFLRGRTQQEINPVTKAN